MGATGGLEGDSGPAEGTLPGGGLGRRRRLFPLHAIEALDHQEHGKGYDEKADDGVDEEPQVQGHGPGGFGCGQGGIGSGGFGPFFEGDKKIRKIDIPQEQADRRHQDVIDKRLDNTPESRPMTMPTAMSTTLPRMANSLKSLNISFPPMISSESMRSLMRGYLRGFALLNRIFIGNDRNAF